MDADREMLERRIAEAKRSMSTRLSELGDRLDRTRRTLSVREQVERHPLVVFGAAVALGVMVGWRRGAARAAARAVRPSTASTALAVRPSSRGLVSTLAHSLVRSLVTSVAATAATRMLEQIVERSEVARDVTPLDDPDRRTTGVRVYPLS